MSQGSYRQLRVESIVRESESAKSFHLVPTDGLPLDAYHPGQHLPVRLFLQGRRAAIFRCYTISNFGEPFYRLTIKKELPPPGKPSAPAGISSGFFHDEVRVGSVIEAKPPTGDFWLDLKQDHPIVLLAGGIGVTPMMSMLEALSRAGSQRSVYFFFALRNAGDHAFKERLREIDGCSAALRAKIFYEQLRPNDVAGRDYHEVGRIDVPAQLEGLPHQRAEYFLCGPAGMMSAVSARLLEQGVVPERIRTESFGPSSTSLQQFISSERSEDSMQQAATVTFARSGVTVPWADGASTLLQFAENSDVEISSGCHYGDCGTCMTKLLEGEVKYLHPTGAKPDPGYCLPCSCRPHGSIVLDA